MLSEIEVVIIAACWAIAMVPLATFLAIFILAKRGILKKPIPEHYPGSAAKLAALLAVGGAIGIQPTFICGGLGGISAMVGVVGGFELIWDYLLLIVLITPALTVITCTAMILYYGWTVPWPASASNTTQPSK